MARKRKELPLLEGVTITGVAAEGKAMAKVDGMALFVPFAAPGDVADIQITRKKSSFAEGRVVRFQQLSSLRSEPFCQHFGVCGGCKWQHLPYEEQLRHKQQQVEDSLIRIGKVELPEITPILGAPQTTFYRNKMEYTFSDKRWLTNEEVRSGQEFGQMNALGFHIPGMYDKVLDIEKCWLQDDLANRIRNSVRSYCLEHGYSFFDLRNQAGLMRTLLIRNSSIGEWMVIVVFYEDDREKIEGPMGYLANEFPQINSLLYIINSKANDTITDQEVLVWKGRDYIIEEMGGLQFRIGPKSFYQTNSEQAHHLYEVARSFAQLTGEERVYDLYTGTGTIANFVARNAKEVIGIEYVEEAIADAQINAQINGIGNARFYAGDMKNVLTAEFIAEQGRPDVVITDPPRAGMHDDVVQAILLAAPQRIVYVSCNPATQARDLNLLEAAYRVTRVQPVDMFPHTHHVENVVLLEKRF
ncbi:23S rRNA (uracil(1939)-C(5))-methyltransferase RlmD [Dysgonomonadaceae bacterium zrk40]|nr:23S rRNA (uracil(1939)-C(5))-methyltransferase RlmD [Dysgonomonadaceae bacterium zrk40]